MSDISRHLFPVSEKAGSKAWGSGLQSHYLFEDRYGRPGKGNDKGKVEGLVGYDAVKHLLLCRIERRPPRLDLDVYPYLPRARVATTAAASYLSLLGGTAS